MQDPTEIVFEETRPGVMETKGEIDAREDEIYRRWDKAAPYVIPAGIGALMLLQVIRDWTL